MPSPSAMAETDWTRPGIYPVAAGVHRIPLPLPQDGLRAVNVYAVEDPAGLILIDSGWALTESLDQLRRALAELGHHLRDVVRVLVTHVHRDHYTQALTLRREFGTRVALGVGERATLEANMRPDRRSLRPQIEKLTRLGATALAEEVAGNTGRSRLAHWELPDEWLAESEIALGGRMLTATHTPGHTRGHLVFSDRRAGLLFAGDHVLPHITPSIGFETAPSSSPLGDYLHSLRVVREMPDMRLLPAHGPVCGSVHQRIDELLDHHRVRLDQVTAAVAKGRHTAGAVAEALGWTRRNRPLDELDVFNRMLAVLETAAHLDLLVARGELRCEQVDGVIHYSDRP